MERIDMGRHQFNLAQGRPARPVNYSQQGLGVFGAVELANQRPEVVDLSF
jgi:hypothetical protein